MSDAAPLQTLDRLCVHTVTNKPWSLTECIEHDTAAGVRGITVWRNTYEQMGAAEAGRLLRESGLEVVSVCRGGFFPAATNEERQAAIDENRRVIDEAAQLGAPLIVLVCGAVPGMPLDEARRQIRDGIAAVLPHAEACGVRLGIEPLHPMFADSRSAVNTMAQANDMAIELDHPHVGVTVDVYHLWWDPDLEREIARCGEHGRLFSYHVCDWRTPTRDMLNDRGLMGEGCIDLRRIRGWVESAGFNGMVEVEIFSDEFWAMDQRAYLEKIVAAWRDHA